ncbi:MAG: TIGR03668 family PPOX class F420-dependent oxidoreductase [Actinomycetota bacterium]
MPALARPAARELFTSARVARLATVSAAGQPHLVPCVFAVDGDLVYSAVDAKPKTTRDLRRLANIASNGQVALLADEYAEDWASLWWVRADGRAAILDTATQMAGPLRLLTTRYPQYQVAPPPGPVIAVTVTRWVGWSASAR